MIVLDGRNVYGINKYELVRKNGNNEIRYLVKFKNSYRRGFESVFDAYVFLVGLKTDSSFATDDQNGINNPDNEPTQEYTVSEAIYKYLDIFKEQVVFGTYDKQRYYFEEVIIPNLPDIPISKISNLDILEFRTKLNKEIYKKRIKNGKKELYSTRSRNDMLQQLKEFLFFAIDNFNVDGNVVKNVKLYKETHDERLGRKEKEENMWSIDEYYSFLDSIEKLFGKYSPTYGIYLVIGNKGLRLGECLALKFNDLKYENMLVVDESITRKTENKIFEAGDPKNESSDRKVVIGSGLYKYLIEVRKRQQELYNYDDKWFIFHRPSDGYMPMAERTLNNHKQAALDAIGLRWNTNHQLRHLYNTFLKDQGIPVYDRSTTLGQKDAEVNSGIYTHMSEESRKKILMADEKLFRRQK